MANEENLNKKGRFQELSKSELQSITRKGGKKKAENERKRKAIKEQIELGLDFLKNKHIAENPHLKEILTLIDLPTLELLKIIQEGVADPQHKLKAISMVFDRTEGKPKSQDEQKDTTINIIDKMGELC